MAPCSINRTLLPIKAHYALYWGGLAAILPFLMTIMQQHGISATSIGVVYAVLPFITMISKPLFGGLADRYQQHRLLFLSSKLIKSAALFILYYIPIPSFDEDVLSRTQFGAKISESKNCTDRLQSDSCRTNLSFCQCLNVSTDDEVPDMSSRATATMTRTTTASASVSYEFVFMCICLVIAWTGCAVAENMGDVIALDLLDEQKRGYGANRVWGSVSWGIVAVVTGLLIDEASRGKDVVDFNPGFLIMAVVGVLEVLVGTRVKVKKASRSKGIVKKVGAVLRRPDTIIFTTQVFVVGILSGVLWTFLVVHLNDLGASQLLIGLTMASQCLLGEIPFFFLADWFLDRIGHANALSLTLAVFFVRFVLYYCIVDPWMVLAVEVSQGVNFGLFFTALATHASLIAPPGTSATVQGIQQAVFEGFGVGVGCLIAGFLFDSVGGAHTFLYFGIAAAVCMVLGLCARMLLSTVAVRRPDVLHEEIRPGLVDEQVTVPMVDPESSVD